MFYDKDRKWSIKRRYSNKRRYFGYSKINAPPLLQRFI